MSDRKCFHDNELHAVYLTITRFINILQYNNQGAYLDPDVIIESGLGYFEYTITFCIGFERC